MGNLFALRERVKRECQPGSHVQHPIWARAGAAVLPEKVKHRAQILNWFGYPDLMWDAGGRTGRRDLRGGR